MRVWKRRKDGHRQRYHVAMDNSRGTHVPPKSAQEAAKKALEWKDKYPDEVKAMTPVGWARARQLARRDPLSERTVKRMAAFNRHRKNKTINPKYKDKPWRDRGYVAWLGWGGDPGVDWARKKARNFGSEITWYSNPNKSDWYRYPRGTASGVLAGISPWAKKRIYDQAVDDINEAFAKRRENEIKAPPPDDPSIEYLSLSELDKKIRRKKP